MEERTIAGAPTTGTYSHGGFPLQEKPLLTTLTTIKGHTLPGGVEHPRGLSDGRFEGGAH